MSTRLGVAAAAMLLLAAPALAQEPVGCDKFKWPVGKEMTALRAPGLQQLSTGANAATPFAATLLLRPPQQTQLPNPPERAPKDGTFAGFVSFKTAPAGIYSVSLSAPAWIDAVQDGQVLKPTSFSGVQGCDGIRKVVKFAIGAAPLILQISNVEADHIAIAVMPATE